MKHKHTRELVSYIRSYFDICMHITKNCLNYSRPLQNFSPTLEWNVGKYNIPIERNSIISNIENQKFNIYRDNKYLYCSTV